MELKILQCKMLNEKFPLFVVVFLVLQNKNEQHLINKIFCLVSMIMYVRPRVYIAKKIKYIVNTASAK